jgi:hypothetical protein
MRAAFGESGYLVHESLLDESECAELRAVAERVSILVTARAERAEAGPVAELADGHRIQFSSRAAIQWEWAEGSREIRLIEPCDHLDERFDALFADERLLGPVRAELGGELGPFTSKLNFKRAREGSEFPWHQDYPYWYVAAGTQAQDVVTAIVFLDDATIDNGALRVIPGSHRNGAVRRNPADPTRFLTDPPNRTARARWSRPTLSWYCTYAAYDISAVPRARDWLMSPLPDGRIAASSPAYIVLHDWGMRWRRNPTIRFHACDVWHGVQASGDASPPLRRMRQD